MVEVIITLRSGTDITTARRALEAAGLRDTVALDMLGVVTGSASEDVVGSLSAVEGVELVERGQVINLPPPDSPLQ